MEQLLSVVALLAQLALWRSLPPPRHNAGALLSLYSTTTALMIVSAIITFDSSVLAPALHELLVRLWYCCATAVYTALTIICGPRLARHKTYIIAPAAIIILVLLLTDLLIAGAQTLPSLMPTSNTLITRLPGTYYKLWLVFISGLVIVQASMLYARIKTPGDGRDQTAAALIATGLIATHLCTLLLASEMTNPMPRFNAQPLIAICCLVFCAVIGYTCTSRLLPAILKRARAHDLAELISVDISIHNSQLTNADLTKQLAAKNLLNSPQGTYVLRQGQALYIGKVTRYAWCQQLEQELFQRHRRWETPKIKIFN